MSRQRGILLHLSSLPSDYGIGGLGKESYDFIDYLKTNAYHYWQILPLNFPGFGNSPYNPISCFAGNPWLIDPIKLYEQGLITKNQLHDAKLAESDRVDFDRVHKAKTNLFRTLYAKHDTTYWSNYLADFMEKEAFWLKPFTSFCHLKNLYKGKSWQSWNLADRKYNGRFYQSLLSDNPDAILYPVLLQFMFAKQSCELKQYAEQKGISIIGDIPLYVSLDSCDVWSEQHLFELNEIGKPIHVTGVPPDAFSSKGQRWGNPLYHWTDMQQDDFSWWISRLSKAFEFADVLRLDHFIGLVNYWAIDAKEKTAINGSWLPGPKHDFFNAILKVFPKEKFIAEDLGILTDEVNQIRDEYSLPGMIVLQFCFEHEHNDVLSFPENKIIYTGTHDNQTTRGWFLSNKKNSNHNNLNLENYLKKIGKLSYDEHLTAENVSKLMCSLAEASPCQISIVPMQDILSLDDKARMNTPGKALGNWHWRMIT